MKSLKRITLVWNCLINLEENPKCSRLFQLPGPLSPSARIIFNQDKFFKLIVRSQKLEKSSLKCIRPLGTKPRDSTQELSLLLRLKKTLLYGSWWLIDLECNVFLVTQLSYRGRAYTVWSSIDCSGITSMYKVRVVSRRIRGIASKKVRVPPLVQACCGQFQGVLSNMILILHQQNFFDDLV